MKWGHPEIQPAVSTARIYNWTLSGKPVTEWSMWNALDTFVILADNFGWETITKIQKLYYTLPGKQTVFTNFHNSNSITG